MSPAHFLRYCRVILGREWWKKMRFRAKLLDISCITHFSSKHGRCRAVQPLSGRVRTAKVCRGWKLCDGLRLELKASVFTRALQ